MARTLTIDGVEVLSIQLMKDAIGNLQVYAQYRVKSGSRVIENAHRNVTADLTPTQQSAALAAFDGLSQRIVAKETE